MNARWTLPTLALCALLAAAACVGPTLVVQQYAGPVRPPETIAILRVNGREPVQLVELDDEDVRTPLASDSRLHIELLPGRHIVSVQNGNDLRSITTLAFEAQAGRVYRAAFTAPNDGGPPARIYEVDRGQDAVVRDVTLTNTRQPAPAPPPPAPPGPQPTPPDAGTFPDAAPEPAAPPDSGTPKPLTSQHYSAR